MRLAVLRHEPQTGLGAFAEQLESAGVGYEVVRTTAGALPGYGGFDGMIALGGSLGVHDARLREARRWIRNVVLAGVPFSASVSAASCWPARSAPASRAGGRRSASTMSS